MNIVLRRTLLGLVGLAALQVGPLLHARGDATAPAVADSPAWTLTMKAEAYDNYLNFPGSAIPAITRIAVYYQPAMLGKPTGKASHYKDLYFSKGKIIGSKQLQNVQFSPQTEGAIIVQKPADNKDPNVVEAEAATSVRFFVDLVANQSFPTAIIVDKDIFPEYIRGVNRYGFASVPLPPPKGLKPKAVLRVISSPPGMSQLIMY